MGVFFIVLYSIFVLSVIPLEIPYLWLKNTLDLKNHFFSPLITSFGIQTPTDT